MKKLEEENTDTNPALSGTGLDIPTGLFYLNVTSLGIKCQYLSFI